MKALKIVVKIIIGIILSISLTAIIATFEFENTILNKNYILKKLDENNYYDNLYSNIINDFKGYIGPSGLDEKIFNDIVTTEKVKEDVNKVIEYIYSYSEEEILIETESIKNKLNENIENYLKEENIQVKNKKTLIDFENKIIEEYKSNITYSQYLKHVKKITSIKTIQIIKKVEGICIIMLIISVAGIILINMKKLNKILSNIMTFMLTCGIIIETFVIYIGKSVNINNITILNTSLSIILRDIANSIITELKTIGIVLIIVSVVLIITSNIMGVKKNEDV